MADEESIAGIEWQNLAKAIEFLLHNRGMSKSQFTENIGISRNTLDQILKSDRAPSSYVAQGLFQLAETAEEKASLRRALIRRYLGQWADEDPEGGVKGAIVKSCVCRAHAAS